VGACKAPFPVNSVNNNTNNSILQQVNDEEAIVKLQQQQIADAERSLIKLATKQRKVSVDSVDSDKENGGRVGGIGGDRVCSLGQGELKFLFTLNDGVQSVWLAKLMHHNGQVTMLIDVEKQKWKGGSKEGFVRLLECAEEGLECADVYVTVARSRSDMVAVMRTFMYLGFTLCAPEQAAELGIDTETSAALLYNIQ
jgi:hypothetical protein